MASERERGIVLRAVAYGESDRIVTFLCEERGKLSALAKGARKSTRRFAGGLALLSVGELSYAERAGSELARLERFDAVSTWAGLFSDLGKIAHASYAAELVEALVPPRQCERAVFRLLLDFAQSLDAGTPSVVRLRGFELQLLLHLGLRPQLEHCTVCTKPATDGAGQRIDAERGGLVCGSCRAQGPLLSGETRAELLRALDTPLTEERSVTHPEASKICVQALLAFALGPRKLRSIEFIDKLNQADR